MELVVISNPMPSIFRPEDYGNTNSNILSNDTFQVLPRNFQQSVLFDFLTTLLHFYSNTEHDQIIIMRSSRPGWRKREECWINLVRTSTRYCRCTCLSRGYEPKTSTTTIIHWHLTSTRFTLAVISTRISSPLSFSHGHKTNMYTTRGQVVLRVRVRVPVRTHTRNIFEFSII